MRRRTRTKYTWFPNIGFQGAEAENDLSGFPFTLTVPKEAGTSNANIFELIPDFTDSQPGSPTDNLVDFVGNEYILKRIVGKCLASVSQSGAGPANIIFGCGFFVARADETAPQVPVGAGTQTEIKLNYGVLNNQNTREPWIWRRVWKFQNIGFPVANGTIGTFGGGSVQDGPHIDARSARRVKQDERLFVCIQAANVDDIDVITDTSIFGYLDYRVLGALRKARGKSAF